ncbi:response regulator [Haematobacter massiliensis]|uniref:Transcriptional regulator n=1 Tax=Haematobacter massiliensis TaxID=195105 RepID=A0A086XYL3_9RHOB|nr:response regulator [Haematobacter massiliensis]KFI27113.1 transcriptional regulator [Haematobacter massiliensis]OWJ73785.1 response regulator [Haematobacter massiliensis]OWJ82455.1 response regulator [Haematobacter massiliensis]QBJ23628.1 response regulator [Haematobacter massiliensis]
MSSAISGKMLSGKNILIVEDEAILALDLTFVMEDMGASVIGPCHRLRRALEVLGQEQIDGAILDVDLAGEAVFPLADGLARRHVPIVFHTGRNNSSELISRYKGAAVCAKPTQPENVALALAALLESDGEVSSGSTGH